VTHHLTIASVATDGSGNISTVTDARTLGTTLLNGLLGPLFLANTLVLNNGFLVSGGGSLTLESRQSGAANGVIFSSWDGSAGHTPFSVGGQFGSAAAWVDNSGNIFAPALQWGVGVSGSFSRVTFDATNHFNVYWVPQAGATALGHVFVNWTGSAQQNAFGIGGSFGAPAWVDASGNYNGFAGVGIPTTRAGVATSVPIYTGTSTPSSPPTGSIWIKA
jgi:hypothetical protein